MGQRFQAPFLGDHRFRPAFRAIRQIAIFQFGHGGRIFNLCLQVIGQFPLLFERGQDRGPSFIQFPQLGDTIPNGGDGHLVQPARHFLPIPRQKGHGGAIIQQRHGGGHLLGRDLEFFRN